MQPIPRTLDAGSHPKHALLAALGLHVALIASARGLLEAPPTYAPAAALVEIELQLWE